MNNWAQSKLHLSLCVQRVHKSATGTRLAVICHVGLGKGSEIRGPLAMLAENIVHMVVVPLHLLFVKIRNSNNRPGDAITGFKAKRGSNDSLEYLVVLRRLPMALFAQIPLLTPEYEALIAEDLRWLGLDWPQPAMRQSERDMLESW